MLRIAIAVITVFLRLITSQQAFCQTAQSGGYSPPAEFVPLLKYFDSRRPTYQEQVKRLPLPLPEVFRVDYPAVGTGYKLVFGNKPLGLSKKEVVLQNPFSAAPFPLSYSVLYRGQLVTLFEPGYFACYAIHGLERNQTLEQQLNKRKFQYHWLLDGQLVGMSDGQYFVFSEQNTWTPYKQPVPFLAKQPKLFEDDAYLSFLTCSGEFGGEVYFYDKHRHQYYLTGATCANSIIKRKEQYYVLSSLGHGSGSADMQLVEDPRKLAL
jgi:hypothetical protein